MLMVALVMSLSGGRRGRLGVLGDDGKGDLFVVIAVAVKLGVGDVEEGLLLGERVHGLSRSRGGSGSALIRGIRGDGRV